MYPAREGRSVASLGAICRLRAWPLALIEGSEFLRRSNLPLPAGVPDLASHGLGYSLPPAVSVLRRHLLIHAAAKIDVSPGPLIRLPSHPVQKAPEAFGLAESMFGC